MTVRNPVAIGFCFLFFAWAFCDFSPAEDNAQLTKIDEGVYAGIVSPDGNAVGNSGVVIMGQGVLVFDTHFTPEAGRELLEQIRSVTSKPVRYVVNSHFHPDHTHGNQAMAGAQLIGSTLTRRDMLDVDLSSMKKTAEVAQKQLEKLRNEISGEEDPSRIQALQRQIRSREEYLAAMSRQEILPPFVTLDDSLTIKDGQREVQLLLPGPGHTEGDTILFLPDRKIAFLGDLFFNQAIPNVQDAHMLEWIKTLHEVLKLNADIFIPGHGPIGMREDVEAFLGYFEDLEALVESAIDRGDSMDQAVREIRVPEKYSFYLFQNFFPSNIQKMYSEIKALKIIQIPVEGPEDLKTPRIDTNDF